MPGPMSMQGGLGPQDSQLLAFGKQQLDSGNVSPEDVQKASEKLTSDPSWLKEHMDSLKDPSMVDKLLGSQGKASPPAAAAPRSVASSKNETKNTAATKTSTNSYLGDDQYQNLLGMVNSNPDIQDQRQGIKDQSDFLKMSMANQAPNSDYWVKPLTALADAQSGSHLSDVYKGQPTQEQKNKDTATALDELQKRKGDLTKNVLDSITKLKSGSQTDSTNNLITAMAAQNMGGNGGGLAPVRLEKLRQDAAKAFNSDKMLTNMENSYNNADRAMNVINGKVPVTNANYNTLQEDVTRMMTMGGSQVADAKLQREATSLFAEIPNKLKTYFDSTGKEADLRTAAPETFKRLQDFISQIRQDYDAAYQQRLKEVGQPYSASPYPEIAEAARAQADLKKNARVGGQTLLEKAGPPPADGAGGKTDLNTDLSKLTPDEVKAWLKTHQKGG